MTQVILKSLVQKVVEAKTSADWLAAFLELMKYKNKTASTVNMHKAISQEAATEICRSFYAIHDWGDRDPNMARGRQEWINLSATQFVDAVEGALTRTLIVEQMSSAEGDGGPPLN